MRDHLNDLLSLSPRNRYPAPIRHFNITTIYFQESFDVFHIYKMWFMGADEVVAA